MNNCWEISAHNKHYKCMQKVGTHKVSRRMRQRSIISTRGGNGGQYILDGKVVRKLRLVGAVYLVDWLDVGPVVGMLESSSQDDISNTG